MLITCLLWFLPIHSYAILQYSGIFPQRVRSHCQGNFWFCFPWQCDSTVTENIPEYCKFHSSDLGKNQCKQGIKFLQLKCHSGIALAYLKRRSIVDSPHRPRYKSKWPRLSRIVLWRKCTTCNTYQSSFVQNDNLIFSKFWPGHIFWPILAWVGFLGRFLGEKNKAHPGQGPEKNQPNPPQARTGRCAFMGMTVPQLCWDFGPMGLFI